MTPKRQLVALMFSDVVDYGTITNRNEKLALELLEEYRAIVRRFIPLYGGRENKTIGDGFFVEFGSAIEAVLCAIEVQTCLYERNLGVSGERRLLSRIGIHLGDVVLAEGDSLGEGVNVAARIEGFADPGGICVSRSVADQVFPYEQIRLKRIGKRSLKHIRHPAILYKVRLPWEQRRAISRGWRFRFSSPRSDRTRHMLAEGLLACVLALFTYLCARTFFDYRAYDLAHSSRAPASPTERVSLDEDWEYARVAAEEKIDPEGQGAMQIWRPLVKPYWRYADELSASYWMRREFTTAASYEHPAIVLGPISGAHRAYLNGHFIGGSNFTFTLAHYVFDPRLLKRDGHNMLLVTVRPKASITPGIVRLPRVPSMLAEFNEVYPIVLANELYFHVAQNIYLALSLLSFFACLVFYAFNPNDKKYLYFSIYLLLGSMSLMHSNGFVFGFLDYRLMRAFRLFGLSLSSLTLLSTYFYLIGRRAGEMANNFLALCWSVGLTCTLLAPGDSALDYLDHWNNVLFLTFAYSAVWVVALFNYRVISFFRDRNRRFEQWQKMRYETVVLFFGVLTALLSLSSMKTPLAKLVPHWADMFTVGTMYPFLFACAVFVLALFDYILKDRTVRYRRQLDDLLLGISDSIRHSPLTDTMIAQIQSRVSEFISAERSTVYLFSDADGQPKLRAHSIFGAHEMRTMVTRDITPKGGILGYVCDSRSALLVRDLANDVRFQEMWRQRTGGNSYRTNSCMVFPLILGNRLVGVLTVADKKGEPSFNERDFSLLHMVAKDLAMILSLHRPKETAA